MNPVSMGEAAINNHMYVNMYNQFYKQGGDFLEQDFNIIDEIKKKLGKITPDVIVNMFQTLQNPPGGNTQALPHLEPVKGTAGHALRTIPKGIRGYVYADVLSLGHQCG